MTKSDKKEEEKPLSKDKNDKEDSSKNESVEEKLKANEEKCKNYIENSLAMCTSLAPIIGYDKAAEISKKAYKMGKTIREICLEDKILEISELDKILDPYNMIESNAKNKK